MQILTDDDLNSVDIGRAAASLRDFLIDDAAGRTASPARLSQHLGPESITLTMGAASAHFGFRAYTTRAGLIRDREDQVVVCWDKASHQMVGVAIGQMLGAWRTGLLGGIARAATGPAGYEVCGVVGTGLQAWTQANATAVLSPPAKFIVAGRDTARAEDVARRLKDETGIPVVVEMDIQTLTRQSNVLICATRANKPVIEISWLDQCLHVTTVGPKSATAHELPIEIWEWAGDVVSDAPRQISAQGSGHFLARYTSLQAPTHLGDRLRQQRDSTHRRTLYLSAGLAGTEVALLASLLS